MSFLEIKSNAKINFSLNIIKKLKNKFHKIESLISIIDLNDIIYIKKIEKNKHQVKFFGKFSKGIKNDNTENITNSISKGIPAFAKVFQNLSPKIIIILGDRYETLAAAIAAHYSRIPIANLHGGETTLGSLDESTRHAITKLSHFHFVANEKYKKRIIQLGEIPGKVFVVGGLGVDSIKNTNTND